MGAAREIPGVCSQKFIQGEACHYAVQRLHVAWSARRFRYTALVSFPLIQWERGTIHQKAHFLLHAVDHRPRAGEPPTAKAGSLHLPCIDVGCLRSELLSKRRTAAEYWAQAWTPFHNRTSTQTVKP